MANLDVRIGEVAASTGVSTATLRAWERRHAILRPRRTPGGHRIYSPDDVARVRAVLALSARGFPLADAAARLAAMPMSAGAQLDQVRGRLWAAVDSFDEPDAAACLREATAILGVGALLDGVLVPTLRKLGDEWRISPRNVAREHFASTLVRAHLVEQLPTHTRGGERCLAFCPQGEQHDIGLVMAAVALAATGRGVIVLGAHTPFASVEGLLRELRPSLVLVAAVTRRTAGRFLADWRPRRSCAVLAGGAGFRPDDAGRIGGRVHHGPYRLLPEVADGAAPPR